MKPRRDAAGRAARHVPTPRRQRPAHAIGGSILRESSPLSPRRLRSAALAVAVLVGVLILLAPRGGPVAEAASSSVETPPPGGLTVGVAAGMGPRDLAASQSFDVESVSHFDVASQRFLTFVVGAPAFANSLAETALEDDAIVFIRRARTQRVGGASAVVTPPAVLGALPKPPTGGLSVGFASASDRASLAEAQGFDVESIAKWDVPSQRFLLYIPGAPEHVHTLGAVQAGDIVFMKAKGPAPLPARPGSGGRPAGSSGPWVTGWYAGWLQNELPPAAIDFSIVTHLMHFMIVPRTDGSLEVSNRPGFESAQRIASVVDAAHAAGRHVLVTVGGAGSYGAFKEAIKSGNRARLVQNLVDFVRTHNYDGVDVDMEPINPDDYQSYQAFIRELRSGLHGIHPDMLVTVAAGPPAPICHIQDQFDQINLMTYDMSGAWEGWVAWHNAPVTSGGEHFPPPHHGRELPSADLRVREMLDAGCRASKLAIGIDFYGYVWEGGSGTDTGGVTRPRQRWASPPRVHANVPYRDIAQQYDLRTTRWDAKAQAAFISVDRPGSAEDRFVSFDNEQTARAKVDYVRAKGLGGLAIWELAGGYLRTQGGVRDPLLQAIGQAFGTAR